MTQTVTEPDLLRRLLIGVATVCVALFSWSVSRELSAISASTQSTNAHVASLDVALRGLLVENASTARRLDYVEELARATRDRVERGCRP